MRSLRWVLTAASAVLMLQACEGSDAGDRPREYQIDQDIKASHGTDIPTSNWRSTTFERLKTEH